MFPYGYRYLMNGIFILFSYSHNLEYKGDTTENIFHGMIMLKIIWKSNDPFVKDILFKWIKCAYKHILRDSGIDGVSYQRAHSVYVLYNNSFSSSFQWFNYKVKCSVSSFSVINEANTIIERRCKIDFFDVVNMQFKLFSS